MRVSNFLLWQIAYAEIWVTDTLWPDFRKQHLLEAILAYQKRDRRYGGHHAARGRGAVTRVLSALVLLPIVVGAVWFLPPVATLGLALVAAALAFLEYAAIAAALDTHIPRIVSGAAVLAACTALGSGSCRSTSSC
jgi:hypothetical protein